MTIVQSVSGTTNGSASIAPSLTGVTAGNSLILLVSGSDITDTLPTDSQTWAKPTGAYDTFTGLLQAAVGVYWLQSANSGSHTVTWTGANSGKTNWSLIEYTPLTAVDVVGTGAHTNGTPTSLGASVTTTFATDAVFGVFCLSGYNGMANNAITDPPAGWTSIYAQQDTATNRGAEFCYKETSSAGSESATWNFTADSLSGDANSILVSFRRASGISLTGNAGTGSVGTVSPTASKALSGHAGTSSAGSVSPAVSKALTGNAGTGGVGTVAPSASKGITGNSSTGSVGSVAPAASVGLSGGSGTGSAGSVGPAVTVGLLGVSAASAVGTVAAVTGGVIQALTGVVGTGQPGSVGIDVVIGLTGVPATGLAGDVSLPSTGGGRDDSKAKVRKRVNELNKKILQAEAQEAEIAVTKAKSAPKSADQGHDEDEEEALMLLL
jgi:hypothetical protein